MRGRMPLRVQWRTPQLCLALSLAVAPSAASAPHEDGRVRAFLHALERTRGDVAAACAAGVRARTRLPSAETWAKLRSLAWPHVDGPRQALPDRVAAELARAELESVCGRTSPAPGRRTPDGEYVHATGSFALPVPADWSIEAGGDWLLARSPERDLAVEVVTFPSVRTARDVARRSRALLGRARRVDAEVGAEAGDAEDFSLEITFRARGREVPVRARWVRLGDRLARQIGVAELETQWREPDWLEPFRTGLRPLRSDEAP